MLIPALLKAPEAEAELEVSDILLKPKGLQALPVLALKLMACSRSLLPITVVMLHALLLLFQFVPIGLQLSVRSSKYTALVVRSE